MGNRENKMRISTPCIVTATLAAASLIYNQVSAATLTVHTEPPKVNVHLPPPKVNNPLPSPKVQMHDLTVTKKVDKSSPQLYDKKSDTQPKEQVQFNYDQIENNYSTQK